jgi:hypothetical protein
MANCAFAFLGRTSSGGFIFSGKEEKKRSIVLELPWAEWYNFHKHAKNFVLWSETSENKENGYG